MKRDEQMEQHRQTRKTWSAPQMVTVDISNWTEAYGGLASDGGGTSTVS